MGVKDLMTWVKKTHPEAIVNYAQRWAAPEMTGKKIAIDGTLLTNRYHFATRDGPHGEKGPIIGWYNLISEMRAHGVKPVAIWDQVGARDWKAPEHRRRLSTRLGHLVRQNHETERASRLECLRDTLTEFERMTDEEKELIRSQWETTRFMFSSSTSGPTKRGKKDKARMEGDVTEPAKDGTAGPVSQRAGAGEPVLREAEKRGTTSIGTTAPNSAIAQGDSRRVQLPTPPPTPPLPSADVPEVTPSVNDYALTTLERVTTMIDSLAHLVQEYRESVPSPAYPPSASAQSPITAGDGDLGLEHIHQALEEQIAQRVRPHEEGEEERRAREEHVKELDELLLELAGRQVGETRTQAELTRIEGEIINAFLSPQETMTRPPSAAADPDKEGYPSPPLSPSPLGEILEPLSTPDSDSVYSPTSTLPESPTPELLPLETETSDPMLRLETLITALPPVKAIYDRALHLLTPADHEDCKELLRIMGVPVLEAQVPYEAEGLASALAKAGLVDYVGTEDSDVLAYEGPLLRHLSPSTSSLSFISGTALRSLLQLTETQYLDFLILLGTDASPRIPKVGPVTALKLIRQHLSIEAILSQEPGIRARLLGSEAEFMGMVNNARRVFTALPDVDEWKDGLEEGEWDEKSVESWLEKRHGIKMVDEREREWV